MRFEPVEFHDGSDITFDVRRWSRDARPYLSIAHLRFCGNYRDGSTGTPDAHYMCGILSIVEDVWRPDAVLLDLRDLAYDWGDDMERLLMCGDDRHAIVVGDSCRRALSTLTFGLNTQRDITELAHVFDHFDVACRYLAQGLLESWNQQVMESSYLEKSECIALADLYPGR